MIGIKKEHNIQPNTWMNKSFGKIIYYTNGLKAFMATIENIKKNNIIHISSLFYYPSFLTALYCYIIKEKLIWSPRGECSVEALAFAKWKKNLILKIIKPYIKNVIFHATSSKETLEIKALFGNVQVVEFPNFFYLEKQLNLPVKNQLIYVGRIHPIKAIENLIQAVALSATMDERSFKLKIAGTYKDHNEELYYNSLVKLVTTLGIGHLVEFVGHVTGEDKTILYSTSYCLILPSHTENFGNVVVEALNQGTPVIAAKNTPWRILEENKIGLHVSNIPEELASAIDTILSLEQDGYNDMRDNAYSFCEKYYAIDQNIEKWIGVYNQCVNQ